VIRSIKIAGFRGIREGFVDELEQVNIIIGKNNSGKSSILEALFLSAREKFIFIEIPRRYSEFYSGYLSALGYLLYRRMDNDEKSLFYNYEEKPLKYELVLENEKKLTYYFIPRYYFLIEEPTVENKAIFTRLDWVPEGTIEEGEIKSFLETLKPPSLRRDIDSIPQIVDERLSALRSALLVDTLHIGNVKDVMASCWEKVKMQGLDELIVDALREAYELNIVNLEYTPSGNWLVTLKNERKHAVRLDDLGDGAKYALTILTEILVAKPSILLIEEPECHTHPKGLELTFDVVFQFIKKMGTQTFITTHSLETLNKLIQLCKKHSLTVKIHHFTLKNGVLTSKPLDAPSVEVVTDLGADIRFLDEYM